MKGDKLLKIVTIFVTVWTGWMIVTSAVASARTFTSPGSMYPGQYKYVENGDGSWTEYFQGREGGEPIKGDTYSKAAMEESDRLYSEIGVDEGTTGQTGSIVIGHDGENMYAAERVVEDMRTGEPYANVGEAEVGDELIADGVSEGTLPSLGTVAAALPGAIVGVGAVAAGVAIGAGIDELLGFPVIESVLGASSIAPGCAYGGEKSCKWNDEWTHEIRIEKVEECAYKEWVYPYSSVVLIPGELCMFTSNSFNAEWSYYNETSKKTEETSCANRWAGESGLFWADFNACTSPQMEPLGCPAAAKWVHCFYAFPGPGGKLYSTPHAAEGYDAIDRELYAGVNETLFYGAYPSGTLKSDEKTVKATTHTVPAREAVATITPPAPATVPAPARHTIIEKAHKEPTPSEIEKDEDGKPLILPEEIGAPIPEPTGPEIPEIKPGETWTEYKPEVEREGYTKIKETIRPETDIDPAVGPEGVTGVFPSPGTHAPVSTEPNVSVNPIDAPEPESHSKIGGPTLPGLKLPELHLLCTTMPFGVPCWIVKQVEAFSATSEAPVWSIGPFHTAAFTIPEAKIHLSEIEPVMEKIRPWMKLFGVIGIVVFFFTVFTGKKLGGGGNPPGQVPGPEATIPEPDEDAYL